jgi:hypothetical protein
MVKRRPFFLAAAIFAVVGQVAGGNQYRVSALVPKQTVSADVELFVKRAIEDRFGAKNIPDGNLLGTSTRIAIREQTRSGQKLTAKALPQREGYEFYLISQAVAQAEADKTSKPVHFITVDSAGIAGDTAWINLGVDVVLPRVPKVIKECCCSGLGQFRQDGERWVFVRWVNLICA